MFIPTEEQLRTLWAQAMAPIPGYLIDDPTSEEVHFLDQPELQGAVRHAEDVAAAMAGFNQWLESVRAS